jgi:hypothetical protein
VAATPPDPLTPEQAKDLPTLDLDAVISPAVASPVPAKPVAPAKAKKRRPPVVLLVVGGVVLPLLCLCIAGIAAWLAASESTTPTPVVIIQGETPVNPPNLPTAETPLARPIVPTNLLYEETFDDPASGWDIYLEENTEADYVDGEYRLAAYRDNFVTWGNPEPGHDLFDFEIRVDARQVEGPLDNNFGILLRYQPDDENYYWFQISGDGYYSVDLYIAGEWATLVGWEPSDAINQGIGATNHLMVTCSGPQCEFFVNDWWLTSTTDDNFPSGNIGLAVGTFDEPGVVVHFDNLQVYTLPQK